jgi:hypothetical protein
LREGNRGGEKADEAAQRDGGERGSSDTAHRRMEYQGMAEMPIRLWIVGVFFGARTVTPSSARSDPDSPNGN